MILPATRPATSGARRPRTFAQVLAAETIAGAGALAWQRVPASGFAIPPGAAEDIRLADGSRVAVWSASGAWVAARAHPGNAGVAIVALPDRPSFIDALELTRLADTATGDAGAAPAGLAIPDRPRG